MLLIQLSVYSHKALSNLTQSYYSRNGCDLILCVQRKTSRRPPDKRPLTEAPWEKPPLTKVPTDKSPPDTSLLKLITRIPFPTNVNFCNIIYLYQYMRKLISLQWDYLCYLIGNIIFIIHVLSVFNAYLTKSSGMSDSMKNFFHRLWVIAGRSAQVSAGLLCSV